MAINNIKIIDISDNQEYTVIESSKLLGITSQTILKYLKNGELIGKKKGPKDKWFITGEEVKRKMKEWDLI